MFSVCWVRKTFYKFTIQHHRYELPSSQLSLFCWVWPSTPEWPSTSWGSALATGVSPGPTYWAGWPCSWHFLQVRIKRHLEAHLYPSLNIMQLREQHIQGLSAMLSIFSWFTRYDSSKNKSVHMGMHDGHPDWIFQSRLFMLYFSHRILIELVSLSCRRYFLHMCLQNVWVPERTWTTLKADCLEKTRDIFDLNQQAEGGKALMAVLMRAADRWCRYLRSMMVLAWSREHISFLPGIFKMTFWI